MLQSANEACNIMAEYLAGSISAWVDRMNTKAKELGCVNTHFSTTNGLPPRQGEKHYSSAYDLYLITREALKFPLFMEIACTESYQPQSPGVNGGKPIKSTNALMYPTEYYGGSRYVYEYAAGVKTGFTQAAGYCLISTAEKGRVHLLAVVMGCDGQLNAGLNEYKNFEASRNLYEWAFNEFSYRPVVNVGQVLATADVEFAKNGDTASLRPQNSLALLLPNDADPGTLHTEISLYKDRLTAPLEAGVVLGTARVSLNGDLLGMVRLVNASAVELSWGKFIRQRIATAFGNPWVIAVILLILLSLGCYTASVLRRRRLRRKRLQQRRLIEKHRREWEMNNFHN